MAEAKGTDDDIGALRMPTMTSPLKGPRRASVHLSDLSSKLAPFGMEHIAGNVDKWCAHLLDIGPQELALSLVETVPPAEMALKVCWLRSALCSLVRGHHRIRTREIRAGKP
jgi:hypothetical protein